MLVLGFLLLLWLMVLSVVFFFVFAFGTMLLVLLPCLVFPLLLLLLLDLLRFFFLVDLSFKHGHGVLFVVLDDFLFVVIASDGPSIHVIWFDDLEFKG